MSQRKKKLEQNLKQIFVSKEQGNQTESSPVGAPLEILTGSKQPETVENPEQTQSVVAEAPKAAEEKPVPSKKTASPKPKSSGAAQEKTAPENSIATEEHTAADETKPRAETEFSPVVPVESKKESSRVQAKDSLTLHGERELVVHTKEIQTEQLRKLLIFKLCEGYFGVSVFRVQTIIKPQPVYPVPGTEDFIIGLINLRGEVVPTVDLHKRLGLPAQERTEQTRFVVVEYGEYLASMIVDEVVGVENIPESKFEKPSDVVMEVDTRYLQEITLHGEKLVLVLDLAELITRKD